MLDLLKKALRPKAPPPPPEARYVYLHIPKTAGSAMKSAIKRSPDAGRFLAKPHRISFADLTPAERALETYVTIRDPLAWYLSLYNFKIHSESDKGYADMPRNSLEDFVDDVIYGRNGVDGYMRWNQPAEHKLHVRQMVEALVGAKAQERIGFFTVNFLYYAAPRWKALLADPDPNGRLETDAAALVGVKHVLRQERLAEDFAAMTAGAPVTVDLATRVNAMAGNPYGEKIAPEAVDFVRRTDSFLFSRYYPDAAAGAPA